MSTAVPPEAGGGLPGPIAETFGAFEPRFYGISFLLETPLLFQAWVASAGIFPGGGGPALTPFEDACLRTAIEHETRHFHDALVSPYANGILMLRMMAAFNGMKLFNRALRSDANCLPIPVMTWMFMSPDERAAWMAEVASDLPPGLAPPLRPLPLPHLDGTDPLAGMKPGMFDIGVDDWEAELQAFARGSIGAYVKAASLMRGPAVLLRTAPEFQSYSEASKRALEATLTPRNVFEASALSVQVQAAWTNIGEDAANALINHLMESDLGYAEAYRRIGLSSAPADRPGMVDATRISAVAVWCLLGDFSDPNRFDPVVRLMRLLPLLEQSGGIAATDQVAALWDSWDERLEFKGWRTAVKEMRERTARSAAGYAAAARGQTGESQATAFAAVLKAYLEDQTRTTDLLLNRPETYVNTLSYLNAVPNDLPVPLTSVELGDNFVAPVDAFPVRDAVRIPRRIDKDGVRGWNRLVIDRHQPPRPHLLDAVLDLEFNCKMCDVAFSDEALRPMDSEIFLNSIAEASGMLPVFVF